MFRGKPIKVKAVGDAKKEIDKLNEIVGLEKRKGIEGSEHQTLWNSLMQKIDLLKKIPNMESRFRRIGYLKIMFEIMKQIIFGK